MVVKITVHFRTCHQHLACYLIFILTEPWPVVHSLTNHSDNFWCDIGQCNRILCWCRAFIGTNVNAMIYTYHPDSSCIYVRHYLLRIPVWGSDYIYTPCWLTDILFWNICQFRSISITGKTLCSNSWLINTCWKAIETCDIVTCIINHRRCYSTAQ